MYPLKFQPIYKNVIWGGNKLAELFGRELNGNQIGESWEISQNINGMSVIANGYLKGKSIEEVLRYDPAAILGRKPLVDGKFPLLIKYIDANDKLSVQVHPNDEYAYRMEGEAGKTEAWYIVSAKEDAKIIYGLKEKVTKNIFIQMLRSSDINSTLNAVPVKSGELYFIPAGMVHALLDGVVVCEVQQNSDVTYRIYDYERVDRKGKRRELHIDKAFGSIDFDTPVNADFSQHCIECEYFSLEKCNVHGETQEVLDNQYLILCVLAGTGKILFDHFSEPVMAGETILIPACLKQIILCGEFEYLKIR